MCSIIYTFKTNWIVTKETKCIWLISEFTNIDLALIVEQREMVKI